MIRAIKNYIHLVIAICANIVHLFPSTRVRVIGITGTDGKTTTTHLIYHILKTLGKKVSMVSSAHAVIGDKPYDTGFHTSTPGSFQIQQFLSKSVANGDEYFVLEVTSHAIDQHRIWGIHFVASVLTNISAEHLDYHRTFDRYVEVKTRLLKRSKHILVNADDQSFAKVKALLGGRTFYTYALRNKASFNFPIAELVRKPILPFNKYNFLAALGLCRLLNLDGNQIVSAMQSFALPPGRLEVVTNDPFMVIIDFAHTPNALSAVLYSLKYEYLVRPIHLIHVFGAAAERDTEKRPLMGEASATYADYIILTEEDYRHEDPLKICSDIVPGIEKRGFTPVSVQDFGNKLKSYTVIIDRKAAIEKAISIAMPGDLVIFTGKGNEKSLCREDQEHPWDERATVEQALTHYLKKNYTNISGMVEIRVATMTTANPQGINYTPLRPENTGADPPQEIDKKEE